jgi:putative transposase
MRAYKFRIYPNAEQKHLMEKHFGCVRHVYNWGLELKDKHYKENHGSTGLTNQKSLSKSELQGLLVQSKKEDKPWLKEVNSQSLLSALLHLETAFINFFKGRAKFPRFKSKYASSQSYQCPQHVRVDFEFGLLYLPKFKTGIKTKFHRHFKGEIKTVTVKRKPSGKYEVSILVDEVKEAVPSAPIVLEQTLGIDLGLTHFLIDSEGIKVDNPRLLKQALERLSKAQKILSRKVKGSKNRRKQKFKVALIHEHVANSRLDFLHKVSAGLVYKNHATSFALEDLNIKGMVKNRKLSRVITDVSWGKFMELLNYKSLWFGKNVLHMGRFEASSKVCNQCLHRIESLPLSVRYWDCPACGAALDRDINAAKNIRRIAIADALGHSVCVKSSPETRLFSNSVSARGTGLNNLYGSQEAPTTIALAI